MSELGVVSILSKLNVSAAPCDGAEPQALRRLAAQRVIEEIRVWQDHPLGFLYLAAWLEGEGRCWLADAGLVSLADRPAWELARTALQNAPLVLDPSRRCANCRYLVTNGDGRVRCGQDIWREQGASAEYAMATVRNSSREPFMGCEYFEETDGEQ